MTISGRPEIGWQDVLPSFGPICGPNSDQNFQNFINDDNIYKSIR